MDDNMRTPEVRPKARSRFSKCNVDVQRSVQKLDEALDQSSFLRGRTPQRTSLSRRTPIRYRGPLSCSDTMDLTGTPSVKPTWMLSRMEDSLLGTTPNQRVSFATFEHSRGEVSKTPLAEASSYLVDEEGTLQKTNVLFEEYLKILDAFPSEHQFGQMLLSFDEAVMEQVVALKETLKKQLPGQNKLKRIHQTSTLLQDESNTWRLVHQLYEDRCRVEADADPGAMIIDAVGKYTSDKDVVSNFYKRDAHVRQCQIVIEWLEKNSALNLADDIYENVEYFISRGSAWENTLNRLQNKSKVSYGGTSNLVTELDFDAPLRQNKQLDDLDREDENRLLKFLLMYIRSGQLDEGQRLCVRYGQPWRAATLEGWRLHHDPNYNAPAGDSGVCPQEIEGNSCRDIWKTVCWRMCEDEGVAVDEKAIYGSLTGNLKAVLPACGSWEDYLWAYFRVLVDMQVEHELRTNMARDFEPLPQSYWDQILSPEIIFQDLQASPNEVVQEQGRLKYHVVQKYIILDDVDSLVEEMYAWLKGPPLPRHLVRFMAHLILFFYKIGRSCKEELCNAILEAYVKDLIDERYLPLVAWYTAMLPKDSQVYWYAKFLEGVTKRPERELCLMLAEDADLDVPAITKLVVENIRNRGDDVLPHVGGQGSFQESEVDLPAPTTDEDLKKIDVIDWLFFDNSQRVEALHQANALIRTFLASNKLEAARAVFAKIPRDSVAVITKFWQQQTGNDVLPTEEDNACREYLCIDTYLQSLESYNDWFEHYYHSRPEAPQIAAGATFTERVALEHKEKQYLADRERWQNALRLQTKVTVDRLYNVILFADGGWMNDRQSDEQLSVDARRQNQMQRLRELCLPKTTFLLVSVFQETQQHKECLKLADTLASENVGLYKIFRKDQLQKFLHKMRESSLALLDLNLDPVGYPIN